MNISFDLSESGIQSAIAALDKYKREIDAKTPIVVCEMMRRGVELVEQKTSLIPEQNITASLSVNTV